MTIPSSAVALNSNFHLGLMEKQIKRLTELARFLPFASQQEEMNKIVKQLGNEAALLKSLLLLWGDSWPLPGAPQLIMAKRAAPGHVNTDTHFNRVSRTRHWPILPRMIQEKTDRANCHFVIKQTKDGIPQIVVEHYHQTISVLKYATLGFDLLGGMTQEQANKVAALLNESVLDVFLSVKQNETVS